MNTQQIYQMALEMVGIAEAPDSQIYHPGEHIHKVMFGIDIGVPELALAKQLGYDAVIAHHPTPNCFTFGDVLWLQAEFMTRAGVPEGVARDIAAGMVEAREYTSQAANFDHITSFAQRLDMPFMNIHLPCDELGRRLMDARIQEYIQRHGTVQDIVDAFLSFPEFQISPVGPVIAMGRPDSPAGKVCFFHGAGTNGGYPVANALFEAGVGTVSYIHIAVEAARRLQAEKKGNLVIAGHIVSDMVGINPFIQRLREAGIQVDGVSGVGFYDVGGQQDRV